MITTSELESCIKSELEKGDLVFFKKAEEADEWGKAQFSSWAKRLKAEAYEIDCNDHDVATRMNTPHRAINYYCGIYHEHVNKFLRYNTYSKKEIEKTVNEIIPFLDQEIKANCISRSILVVRWIDKKSFLENYGSPDKLDVIIDKAYMSTSLHLEFNKQLHNHDKHRDINHNYVFYIKVPAGYNCIFTEEIGDKREQEMLLRRNTKIRIINTVSEDSAFFCSVVL
jgi:hypothetical protein